MAAEEAIGAVIAAALLGGAVGGLLVARVCAASRRAAQEARSDEAMARWLTAQAECGWAAIEFVRLARRLAAEPRDSARFERIRTAMRRAQRQWRRRERARRAAQAELQLYVDDAAELEAMTPRMPDEDELCRLATRGPQDALESLTRLIEGRKTKSLAWVRKERRRRSPWVSLCRAAASWAEAVVRRVVANWERKG